MFTITSLRRGTIALLSSFFALSAMAHHSTAEFDYSKQQTLKGTVKEVQWTNPHSFIQLLVPVPGKDPVEWAVEIGSPSINIAMGWKKTSVKRGDVVTLLISPARDGSPLGTLRKLTFEDGRELTGVAGRVRSTPPAAPAQGR
jgi:hypothetical protein